ncbi:predicted protein [Aspergillus terreus NIH2624]|uniref:Uncharacterized protein n=1 Tax=Aspergillus terreus (strain NIH 2624 / FGSC A1156) TaxID=341663 RepID=Q0CWR1_ASPTN|nr:uncharacterized protein ATEG_01873 [Aspergillus terreus NIH2624]EAU38630.1 predicted protein [Aspergillus terreus NIH2624]
MLFNKALLIASAALAPFALAAEAPTSTLTVQIVSVPSTTATPSTTAVSVPSFTPPPTPTPSSSSLIRVPTSSAIPSVSSAVAPAATPAFTGAAPALKMQGAVPAGLLAAAADLFLSFPIVSYQMFEGSLALAVSYIY